MRQRVAGNGTLRSLRDDEASALEFAAALRASDTPTRVFSGSSTKQPLVDQYRMNE